MNKQVLRILEREADPLEANPIRRREGGGGNPLGRIPSTLVQSPFSWASGVAKVTSLMRIASGVANVIPVKIPVFMRRESP